MSQRQTARKVTGPPRPMMFAKRDVNGEPEDEEEDYSDPEDEERSISSGSSSEPGSAGEDDDDFDGEDGDFEKAVPASKKRYRDSDDEGHEGRHEESSGDEGNGDVKKTEEAAGQEISPNKKARTEEGNDQDDNE